MVEEPKMSYFNHNFRTTILSIFTVFTLALSLNINGQEQSAKPAPKGWLDSIWSTKSTLAAPEKPIKPESPANQLQAAVGNLRYYYTSTPTDLDLSETDRAIKIEEFAIQIDRLISDHRSLDLSNQPIEFYWGFSFPATELLALNKLETLKKYISIAKITPKVYDIVGLNFAFIGITRESTLNLITKNKLMITENDQVLRRCCLWEYLVKYQFAIGETETANFLTETLNSNIPSAIEFSVKRSCQDKLGSTLEQAIKLHCTTAVLDIIKSIISQHAAQPEPILINAISCHCAPEIIDALVNALAKNPVERNNLLNYALLIAKDLNYRGHNCRELINRLNAVLKIQKPVTSVATATSTPISLASSASSTTLTSCLDTTSDCDAETTCSSEAETRLGSPSCRSRSTGMADSPHCREFMLDLNDTCSVVSTELAPADPIEQTERLVKPVDPVVTTATTPIPVPARAATGPACVYIIKGIKITCNARVVPGKPVN